MKTILFLSLFSLVSLNLFAADVDILSSKIGVKDYGNKKSLCLTVVRVPETSSLIGIVESIEDCFYARQAKKSSNHKMELNLKYLKEISDRRMQNHLQTLDAQLKFYFSDGE